MIQRKKTIDDIVEEINSIKRKMGHESRSFFINSNITYTQWMVITFIHRRDNTNIKEIADNLNVTSSAATQLVDGLVKNGYLKRLSDENDRRAIKLILTEKTKKQAAEIKTKFRQKFASMFEVLNDKELAEYYKLNRKIISNLK